MNIEFGSINIWAVLVAGVATFLIGGAWYTALFGKAWQKAHHYDDAKVTEMQAKFSPAIFFGTMIVCYLVIALATALIIHGAGISTLSGGATVGFLIWIIVASVGLTGHISTDVAAAGYLIDTTYQLIYCIGTGALLGAWQ